MSRLTKRGIKQEGMIWFVDHENNNITLEPCEISPHNNRVMLEKLADYEDKEEQGLLIELPCKVGDVVYFPIYDYHDSAIIESIRIEENGIFLDWCQYEVGVDCTEVWDEGSLSIKDFGKTVFLTRSEAEEALAKMGGK